MASEFALEIAQADCRPARGKIQAGYWRGFKQLVGRMGGNHHRILERHDIDADAFEYHDYHVDCIAALNLLEYCSSYFDDPLFGLHLADVQQPDAFGCISVVARAAPTFGQGLQCLVDFIPVLNSPEGVMEVVTAGATSELRWSSELGAGCEQAHFHGLLLIMKTLRMLGRPGFEPSRVNLCFEPSSRLRQEIEQKAGCPLQSGSSANAIAFPTDLLDEPNPWRNALVYNMLGNCLARMSEEAAASVIERVEHCIRAALPSGNCTIERCAEKLGLSTRTLQKQLARRDTSFSELLERQRGDLARRALANTARSIDEIAFDLGYSEQSSFGRAFKRWTGLSPQSFRIQSRLTQ